MGFMEPYVYYDLYVEVEHAHGGFSVLPAELLGLTVEGELASEDLPGLNPYLDLDLGPPKAARVRLGWFGRYSAEGYLDCTPWEAGETEAELRASLDDQYGDPPEDPDDDQEGHEDAEA